MKIKSIYIIFALLVFSKLLSAQNALDFNGLNAHVNLSNNSALQSTNSITLEAWINADTWSTDVLKGTIASNSSDLSGNSGFELHAVAGGMVIFNLSLNGVWQTLQTEPFMLVANWYHLAAVYDGTSMKIYVNGIEKKSKNVTGNIDTYVADFQVGGNPSHTQRNFNGKIDEVRLWKCARTASQLRDYIQNPLIGNETNLALNWRFDEGTGTIANDISLNANHGTLVSMSSTTSWVANFVSTLENLDVSANQIIQPISGEQLSNSEQVTLRIWNYSINSVSNFDVTYKINNESLITETVNTSIMGLSYFDYNFNQKANLSVYDSYYIKAYTSLIDDSNIQNDTTTITVRNFETGTDYSLKFDGIDDKVIIPDNVLLNPTNALTVEAWIKADEWKPSHWLGTIISKDADNAGIATGYVLRTGNNGTLSFVITPNWTEIISNKVMRVGRWYHVAGVFDGTEMKIFINGILEGFKQVSTPINISTADLCIGESSGFLGRVFNGNIDEVRIWNIARTQQQISDNLNTSLMGNEQGLVAYYKFNEGSGVSVLSDLTSNNFDGNLTNMDNDNAWDYGYQLTMNDIGITNVLHPGNSGNLTSAERVKVNIKNFGFNPISNFPISYIYRNQLITENVSTSIPPFGKLDYSFNSFIDADIMYPQTLKVFTGLPNDIERLNDTISTQIIKSNVITVFDHVLHNFAAAGQSHNESVVFPENLDNYSQILIHISLDCPPTGCDPWDQTGKISLNKNGHNYEIARFITPYGKACGPWTVDITDFKSLLYGNCDFNSYIQVWGGSGWLVTVKIELVEGIPDYKYSKLTPLWETDYWIYGDPAISYDLPEMSIPIESNVEKSVLRMTTTGHGQANTDNAAEFSEKTHHIWVDGVDSYSQYLWKADCNVNTCSPQSGTWIYARAGWCPGQEVTPTWFDLTSHISPGNNLSIDYVLQNYTNYLNTGYNGSSHTEPNYRIHSCLVNYSSSPFSDFNDLELSSIISPVNENPNPTSAEAITVSITNNGTQTINNYDIGFYVNNNNLIFEQGTQAILSGQTINFTFSQTIDLSVLEYAELVAFVNVTQDNNAENDAKRIWTGIHPLLINKISTDDNIKIFPNPTKDKLSIVFNNIEKNVKLQIFDNCGKLLKTKSFETQTDIDFTNFSKGIYFIKIITETNVVNKKIIIY